MTEQRKYGEERPGDSYGRPCAAGCRLARSCGGPCAERMPRGACRLEVRGDRVARVVSAYYDNRRGILASMTPQNGLSATVVTARVPGLPENDPVFVCLQSRKAFLAVDLPDYVVRAEGLVVDGPHNLTLLALRRRLDGDPPRRKGGDPADPQGRQ